MLILNVDASALNDLMDLEPAVKKIMDEAIRDMAVMAHGKVTEIAAAKLHSRREMYVDALSYHEVEPGTWLVVLDAEARWIDDGSPEHNQLDALLASPKAKRSLDGSTCVVVPFKHGPGLGPTNSTPAQQDLVATLKKEMKSRNIPFGGIEKDAQGNAKTGRLHRFDISSGPLKNKEGAGQGWGPNGDVRQGPNERQKTSGGPGGGGTPFLNGVSVYQNKSANGKVSKSIMTFRVASSKQREQSGRWDMPEIPGIFAFEDALQWVEDAWLSQIQPAILEKIGKVL